MNRRNPPSSLTANEPPQNHGPVVQPDGASECYFRSTAMYGHGIAPTIDRRTASG